MTTGPMRPVGACSTFWLARRLRLCCRMYTWRWIAEVGYSRVRQEMLCGSHTLYPNEESICMTSLPEHLAKSEDANFRSAGGRRKRS